jgi:hypothetical protein
MYSPGKILMVGGKGTAPASILEKIDIYAANPRWQAVRSMRQPRARHFVQVLPDLTVWINGGTRGAKNEARLGVLAPELWNPQSGNMSVLAAKPGYPQLYHSSGVLLPDGRILTGGGGEPPFSGDGRVDEFWIYRPWYLFQGSRPTITSVSDTSLGFGQSFSVGTAKPSAIARVTMLHLPSQTHGYNFGQGAVELPIKSHTASSLNLVAPAKTDIPPGPYYLFIIDARGVPSVAKIVQIR